MDSKVVVKTLEGQEWLEPLGEALQDGITRAFDSERGRTVRDFLHGKWLGHPLHPVLTDIPIGAWTVAITFDAMEAAGKKELAPGADAAVGIGLIGAVGAAVTGLTDWHHLNEKEAQRTGLVHALFNVAATTLFGTSMLLRKKNKRGAGQAVAVLGYLAAVGGAYLGGTLVYDQKVGVDHAPDDLPEDWKRVLPEADLQDSTPFKVEVDEIPVVLVKRDGVIYALANKCSHLGGPLNEGELEGNCIRCPWHGSLFALEDGSVEEGPSTFSQPAFDVRVRDGHIEVKARDRVPAKREAYLK